MSTNGSYQLTIHFPTENELFISLMWIYPCVHRWTFGINKRILDRSFTEDRLKSKQKEGKMTKWNIEKSLFGNNEMGYTGFWVTNDGVKPIDKKYKQ